MTEQHRRYVRAGEALALDPGHIHAGPEGMFWLCGGSAMPSERTGAVAVVHVRDALDHHATSWDDNYESILARVTAAMSGQDAAETHKREHQYDEGYQPVEASPPSAVVLCIDSPGGVVSGLNETVFALQRLRKSTGVRLVAYVNELAASAAYALACACEKIYCPPSAIVGSVGVISTMISQDRKNKADGYDVALLTSGACKADGHVHAPQTSGAMSREQARVDKLAAAFFKLASEARKIPVATVQSFQAAIYLGPDAARRKLVDEVCSFDETLLSLQPEADAVTGQSAKGNETDRRASRVATDAQRAASKSLDRARHTSPTSCKQHGVSAMVKIKALITRTLAAIATTTDPDKLAGLYADLSAYKKTEKHIEHHTTEEGEPDEADPNKPDPDGGEDDEEDDEEAAAAKKKAEEAAAAEGGEEDDEEAKAALALVRRATGRKGNAAIGAATAMFAQLEATRADVRTLKARAEATDRAALVARAERYAPKRLVAPIASGPLATLRAFVEEAEKGAPMLATSEGDLIRPKAPAPGTEESLTSDVLAMIDTAVASCGLADTKAFRAQLVAAHLKAHTDRINAAASGAQGRY